GPGGGPPGAPAGRGGPGGWRAAARGPGPPPRRPAMRATRRGRPDSAARLRALTRRAYTATAGHLDLEANPERDEDAAREFDRIVSGGPPDPAHSRRDHRAQAARRWAVSGRAVVAVLAVLAPVTGAVVARAIATGPSDAA